MASTARVRPSFPQLSFVEKAGRSGWRAQLVASTEFTPSSGCGCVFLLWAGRKEQLNMGIYVMRWLFGAYENDIDPHSSTFICRRTFMHLKPFQRSTCVTTYSHSVKLRVTLDSCEKVFFTGPPTAFHVECAGRAAPGRERRMCLDQERVVLGCPLLITSCIRLPRELVH